MEKESNVDGANKTLVGLGFGLRLFFQGLHSCSAEWAGVSVQLISGRTCDEISPHSLY